jgi:uncharacterized pyridoxal phosphate-containing UPF0001 family protein
LIYNVARAKLSEHPFSASAKCKAGCSFKTNPAFKIKELYDLGQKAFGENKVQELLEKQPVLPNDIEWHLIGHLQTNKVKYIAGFITMIESIDSEKLLKEVDKEAAKNNRKINILLRSKSQRKTQNLG